MCVLSTVLYTCATYGGTSKHFEYSSGGAGRGFSIVLLAEINGFNGYKKIKIKLNTVPTIQIHCRISFLAVLRSNRLCRHLSGVVLLFDFLSEQQ